MTAKVLRLELYNFKSYNGRAIIGPFHDFSCIVGPNGSGKSNLMDALSFVLGANATVLRSANVQDFINRKAKKQECSVTLVLRQPAGGELALTRAIDGKGAVKVSVDNHAVSEKEFSVILKKSKIGSRINTFLVFQHEVDAVAQKKAKDLTELIEDISGSGELKDEYLQKKKALDHANEVLTAASIEKRGAIAEVNQMRLHKKEADKFNEVNEKLNQERRELALSELFFIEGLLHRQKKELDVFQEEVKKLQTTISSEDDLKAMKKLYADKHKEYLEFLKKNRTVSHDLRDKKGTLDRIKASLDHLQKKHDQQNHELKLAQSSNQVRSTEAARLEAQLKQQESLLAAFEENCKREDRENTQGGSLTADQMKEYRRLKADADCETITARQELETARRQRDSLNEGLKQATIAIENQESIKKELQLTVDRYEERTREATTKRADLSQQVAELEAKIAQGKSSLQLMHAKKAEREAELASIQNQLHELRFVKEDNKNNAKMSEALQSLRAIHAGIRGRLVDLCEIPNSKYRNAVTVAFGKNLDAVVVDTTETAVACVRYLKEQRIASMTFIPLNSAQGKAVDDSLRGFRGTCKPIVDVIKFDPILEPAIRYSIGQALVCDTMDEAKNIAYHQQGGQRYKVVTVDGTLLNKNGSIQGGLASIQSRARKWDEKKYDDLKAARDKLQQETSGGGDGEEAKAVCELQDMQSRCDFCKNRIKTIDAEITAMKNKIVGVQMEAKRQEETIAQLQGRKEKYVQAMQKCETDMIKAQKSVSIVEGRIFADFQKRVNVVNVADLERREAKMAKDRAEKRQQLLLVIHKLKASIESETKRVGVKSPKELEEITRKTAAEIATCKKDLQTYQTIADGFEKKQEEAQRLVTKAKAELDALEEKIRSNSKSSEGEIRKLAQARKNVTMLQAACDALRAQRLSLFQRCRMEQTDLPVVDAASVGSKRQRDGGDAPRGRNRNRNQANADDEDYLNISEAFTSYSDSEARRGAATEVSVCVDFATLPDTLRRIAQDKATFVAYKQRAESTVDQLERELESIAPNLKATMRFTNSENKLGATAVSLEEAREKSRKLLQEFTVVKELRAQRFMETFEKVVEHVDRIYRELTLGTRAHDVHGSAYLTLEDAEEPYNGGTKYHATPPMKRFMTMELLSGGERTMAALALLFAIHAISPTPFFVLDEVDAALDIGNVEKLAKYLRTNSANCQYIVVSLKEQLYHEADTLIGVYKDREQDSSSTVTVDLRKYPLK